MAGLLRATVRREGLEGRVRMLGAVPSERVRDVLVRTGRQRLLHLVLANPSNGSLMPPVQADNPKWQDF